MTWWLLLHFPMPSAIWSACWNPGLWAGKLQRHLWLWINAWERYGNPQLRSWLFEIKRHKNVNSKILYIYIYVCEAGNVTISLKSGLNSWISAILRPYMYYMTLGMAILRTSSKKKQTHKPMIKVQTKSNNIMAHVYHLWSSNIIYPLVICYIAIEHGLVEIMDCPAIKWRIFLYLCKRLPRSKPPLNTIKSPWYPIKSP